jgi:THO complex subunit 4
MSAMDLSLDDIIKKNRARQPQRGGGQRSRGGGAPRGRRHAGAPVRRGGDRRQQQQRTVAPRPYRKSNLSDDTVWEHDMYNDDDDDDTMEVDNTNKNRGIQRGGTSATKLSISGLDYNVSENDIKDLFGSVGDLQSARIHFDRSGRSKGTAEVVFVRRADALSALKQYNGVSLDGKPMNITLVSSAAARGGPNTTTNGDMEDLVISAAPSRDDRVVRANTFGNRRNTIKSNNFNAKPRFQKTFVRGRRPFRSSGNRKVTPESLDAELDAYNASTDA